MRLPGFGALGAAGILLVAASIGCEVLGKRGTQVEKDSTVKMHYTLSVEGRRVDGSQGKDPLVFVQGSGQILPGLEEQLLGMKRGDVKKVTLQPEKGYGRLNPGAFLKVARKSFQSTQGIKVGAVVSGEHSGRPFQAVVSRIGGEEIVLDLNHPLAGKVLDFDVEVIDILAPRPGR